jgi:serine/threonine-protein phosphatase PGAM5
MARPKALAPKTQVKNTKSARSAKRPPSPELDFNGPTKLILLVRHGQYAKDPERLTPLGKKQARLVGQRLRQFKINKLWVSPLPRARETADWILDQLKSPKLKRSQTIVNELQECLTDTLPDFKEQNPGFPPPGVTAKVLKKELKQADQAYATVFVSPHSRSPRLATELVVAHGNLIRHLTLRALGVDPRLWTRLDIRQSSLTIIELRAGRSPRIAAFADTGHLAWKDATFL